MAFKSNVHVNVKRYVLAETLVSVAVNAILGATPIAFASDEPLHVAAASLPVSALAPLFMGAFMSALVPSLLTRRRLREGPHRPALRHAPGLPRIVLTAACLAASAMLAGALIGRLVSSHLAGQVWQARPLLVFDAAAAILAAALVTPSALVLLFGRVWRTPVAVPSSLTRPTGPITCSAE